MRTSLTSVCSFVMSLGITLGASVGFVASAQAHEFWLDPVDFAPAPQDGIAINTRVGQDFRGSSFPNNPSRIVRSEAYLGEVPLASTARMGDRPGLAFDLGPDADGLVIVGHQTANDRLKYSEWEKFVAFVENKDLEDTLAVHRALGLPDQGFTEVYGRYGKTLIAVGSGAGEDRALGLETEIVAQENPYTGELSDGFTVQVLYQGAPRADQQVEVFALPPSVEGEEAPAVTSFKSRTDDQGLVTIPVEPGHKYLIDAVKMRLVPKDPDKTTLAVWESLWASLTFEAPAER